MIRSLIIFVLRVATRVFFREIAVTGLENVPAPGSGPVIFAGNHPNSLVDPVLIITTCERKVHFAAKDTLFKTRFICRILEILGCVPIRRRMDHGSGTLDNSEAFAALFDVLKQGGIMGIFPEGISHDGSELSRLKTGAARIALGAGSENPGLNLTIIPCGLTYTDPVHFRTRVMVKYGDPVVIDSVRLQKYSVEPEKEVRRLTADIDGRLRGITINARDWDTIRFLEKARELYQPERVDLETRLETTRLFTQVYPDIENRADVRRLTGRIQVYLAALDDLGLSTWDIMERVSLFRLLMKTMGHTAVLFIWAFLALPGAVFFIPTGLAARVAAGRLSPRRDVRGATKLMAGLLFVSAEYLLIIFALWWRFGTGVGLLALVIFPLSGIALIRALETSRFFPRVIHRLRKSLFLRREIRALRQETDQLRIDVTSAVDQFQEEFFPEG